MTHKSLRILATLSALASSKVAFAAGAGAPPIISYYEIILHNVFHHDHHAMADWKPVLGSLLTLFIVTVIGLIYKTKVDAAASEVTPDGKFGLRSVVETVMEFVHDLANNVIGPDRAGPFLSTLFGVFLFIFVSNLTGLVPGFTPATESISTNLVLGGFVFLVFNAAGIKEHGLGGYLKTYAGPILFMMPFIFAIEFIGMTIRPVSLALRLYGNIFGDHLVLSVFTSLTKLVLPALLLFFGLLVACLQSFVFTLLSGIYISMAISHDH